MENGISRDDVIRMAREAGFEPTMWQLSFGYDACGTHETFERFAALVAAAEREACAKVCDFALSDEIEDEAYHIMQDVAAAIRARGQG